jgi:hypothetical protein
MAIAIGLNPQDMHTFLDVAYSAIEGKDDLPVH